MTQTADDGPEINPSVVFLYDLLKWVRQGRIRVPAFQRSYVWTRPNMLDLFDSVRRRYPLGTLLFWRSPRGTSETQARFGPFDLSQTRPPDSMFLLDGQQRLTTLAGVLLRGAGLPPHADEEDEGRWSVYFDAGNLQVDGARQAGKPTDGTFMHLRQGDTPTPWQIPLHSLADTNTLFQAVGGIFQASDEALKGAGVAREILVARLQGVARALQSYRIPIVEFVTDDLNLAVESFTRLNRKGVRIGADEMFSALTYQAGAEGERFHIAREIDKTLAAIKETGFGKVDRVLVLRAFLVAAELDPYRTDWSQLGDETRKQVANKLPQAMERAREGLLRGIAFLRDEQIHNARMLPYGLQLVGLSAWFGEDPQPRPEAIRLLRRWLWHTGFASWFGQGNPSRYTLVLNELRDQAGRVGQEGAAVPTELRHLPWSTRTEPFPERYDLRSARVRALLCLLARDGVCYPNGDRKRPEEIARDFAENGPEAMRTVWSRSTTLRSSPANRMFDVFDGQRGQGRSLLKRIADQGQLNPDFLASHLLPPLIADALRDPVAMEQVLTARLNDMIAKERAFMQELQIPLPASAEPGPSLIDQEDESPLSESDGADDTV